MPDYRWKKSTYSPDASNCVEIATTPITVNIRDSKDPQRARLAVPISAWTYFISHTASASTRSRHQKDGRTSNS